MNGYLHPQYAQSLAEFGEPIELKHCGGWLLKRPIYGTEFYDAMGCYPLFMCSDWSQLPLDLAALADNIVSIALVADPFGSYTEDDLKQYFPDVMIPFKQHYVADLQQPIETIISKHHRYYAGKALESVQVEVCTNASDYLDQWIKLYDTLTDRHRLTGIKAFSRDAFAKQLAIPGMVMISAHLHGEIVSAHLWYIQENVAYSHLAASSHQGYAIGAAYAVHKKAIEYFRTQAQWLHIGAGAGINTGQMDGLSRFKKGWATNTRPAYFCGRVLMPDQYTDIIQQRAVNPQPYFPLYRAGEF